MTSSAHQKSMSQSAMIAMRGRFDFISFFRNCKYIDFYLRYSFSSWNHEINLGKAVWSVWNLKSNELLEKSVSSPFTIKCHREFSSKLIVLGSYFSQILRDHFISWYIKGSFVKIRFMLSLSMLNDCLQLKLHEISSNKNSYINHSSSKECLFVKVSFNTFSGSFVINSIVSLNIFFF